MLIVCIIIAVFAAAADQVTKALIFGHDGAFIPGLIRFESVENRGMVWGLDWYSARYSAIRISPKNTWQMMPPTTAPRYCSSIRQRIRNTEKYAFIVRHQ